MTIYRSALTAISLVACLGLITMATSCGKKDSKDNPAPAATPTPGPQPDPAPASAGSVPGNTTTGTSGTGTSNLFVFDNATYVFVTYTDMMKGERREDTAEEAAQHGFAFVDYARSFIDQKEVKLADIESQKKGCSFTVPGYNDTREDRRYMPIDTNSRWRPTGPATPKDGGNGNTSFTLVLKILESEKLGSYDPKLAILSCQNVKTAQEFKAQIGNLIEMAPTADNQ